MASITISDLHLTGYALFDDSESFMTDLVDSELAEARGGGCFSLWGCCKTIAVQELQKITDKI
jgi:hypothetical protein